MAETLGSEFKSSGITEKNPRQYPVGAGTIHRGLRFTENVWNFAESLVGATSGGSKFEIVPEVTQVEVDGALVAVKELDVKQGETATMEVNFVELTPDIIKASVIGRSGSSDVTGYSVIESKSMIEEGITGRISPLWVRRSQVSRSLLLWITLCVRPGCRLRARTKKRALKIYIPLQSGDHG